MTVATVDTLGRRLIQNAGFLMMTLFLAILAGAYTTLLNYIGVSVQHTAFNLLSVCVCGSDHDSTVQRDTRSLCSRCLLVYHISNQVFVWLYAMTFFFANWGPNATTFIIPSEVFPSKWRCTAHGFSAACGKAGEFESRTDTRTLCVYK
jgi:hypothetical protein